MAPIQNSDPTMPNPSTRHPLSTHSLDPVLSLDSWVGPTPSLGPAQLGRVTWHSRDIPPLLEMWLVPKPMHVEILT